MSGAALLLNVSSTGAVLSTEHIAALQSSLVLLRSAEKFTSVKYWGRIIGTARDYFIAQGVGENELTDRKTFFSTDCVLWAQLPVVHPVIAASAKRIKTRFTGTASTESFVTEPGPSENEAPLDLPADVSACRKSETKDEGVVVTTVIIEEKRLAATIAAIDHECAIVPHGAYVKTADGTVLQKRNFEGLSTADSAKLHKYLHFRVPIVKRTALERSQQDKSVDFLDLVSSDVPEGCWSLQYERGGQVAVLKSLLWPGFTFYHCPGTQDHGYIYNGTAQKNADLAFMLP